MILKILEVLEVLKILKILKILKTLIFLAVVEAPQILEVLEVLVVLANHDDTLFLDLFHILCLYPNVLPQMVLNQILFDDDAHGHALTRVDAYDASPILIFPLAYLLLLIFCSSLQVIVYPSC